MFLLILAGIELSFFIVVHGTMCWICDQNSVNKTGIFSHCWAALTQHHGLFYFSTALPASRLGPGKKFEGDPGGQLSQGIFHTRLLRNKSKGGGREDFARVAFGQGLTGHQLVAREQLGIFCITCVPWVCSPLGLRGKGCYLLWIFFCFLLFKLSLTQPVSFCTSTLTILSSIPLQRREWRAL